MRVGALPTTDQPTTDLFVYGSLSFAEVQQVLLGRLPGSRPAAVTGWRNAALRDRAFPGLVAQPGGRVTGSLLTDLTPAERALLDAYEGPMYEARALPLADGGLGLTYVCVDASLVLHHDWDRDHFGRYLLQDYLTGVTRWLAASARAVTLTRTEASS
jgi:gamma-glutamyl AIG2-like cyclotransferase